MDTAAWPAQRNKSDTLLTALEGSVAGMWRKVIAQPTTIGMRGGLALRELTGEGWEEPEDPVPLVKVEVTYQGGTMWAPVHRVEGGPPVAAPYAKVSPAWNHLRAPRHRAERAAAAAEASQSLLQGFRQERRQDRGVLWLA